MKENNLIKRIRLNTPSVIMKYLDIILDFTGKYILSPIIIIAVSSCLAILLIILILLHFTNSYQPNGNEIIAGLVLGYVLGLLAVFVTKLFN